MNDTNEPVQVSSVNDILKLKVGTYYTFDCRRCGKTVLRPRRTNKAFTTKRMLCHQCNVKASIKDRYGVECIGSSKEIQNKIKATNNKRYGVDYPLNRKDIFQKTVDTVKFKYGTDNVLKLKKFREKAKKTNKKKYGDENYNNREKAKDTNKKKYGVEHVTQSEEFKEKVRQTNLAKYGVKTTLLVPEVQEKIKETIKDKYNVDNPMQSEEVKEKVKKTVSKRYGVEYVVQSPEFREKAKLTNLRKYGVDNPLKSPKIRDKIKQSTLIKYGVEHIAQSKEYQEKIEQSNLRKYGVKTTLLVPEVQEKIKETNLRKYGVEYLVCHPDVIKRVQKTRSRRYMHDNESFDSSWELALWIYAKDHGEEIERVTEPFEYVVDGKTHYYYPDFKYKGELIEIKGKQFMNDGVMFNPYDPSQDELFAAKQQCAIDNGVRFMFNEDIQFAIDYARNKYGGSFQWYNHFATNLLPPVKLIQLQMMPLYIYPAIPMMLPWWMFMTPCDFTPYSTNVFEREGMEFVDCE